MKTIASRFVWKAAQDHPAFAGHFPGLPIIPGVVLLDTIVRRLVADNGLCAHGLEVRSAKFLSPVRPGEWLDFEHRTTPSGVVHFEIFAGARKVAVGDLAMREPHQAA